MTSQPEFDDFYVDTRHRLLLATWALTGDLPVARRAVRDAYVAAWHRWSKVARAADPESIVRASAWASAQRRSSVRPWHREKGLDDEVRATLEALQKLSPVRRRVLILSHLTAQSLAEIGREVGIVDEAVERELQTATAQYSLHGRVPSTSVRATFEPLSRVLDDTRWPRVTIIRRAGATRRRVHVAAGATLTVGALVVSGVAVTETGGTPTSLETERLAGGPAQQAQDAGASSGLDPRRLTSVEQASRLDPDRRWREIETSDNTAGDGLAMPCQAQRFADPEGEEALVRTLRGRPAGDGDGPMDLTQMTEMSGDVDDARSAYQRTLRWFSQCAQPRVQLLATEDVADVGDRANLFVLRSWADPVTTYTVGVARTGQAVTTLVREQRGDSGAERDRITALLATSVNGLCGVEGTGTCAGPPSASARDPLPLQPAPGMLGALDLPPAGDVAQPWVSTEPAAADVNAAATRCDDTDFSADPITDDLTRTFVIPEADLADEFGLTETVGVFPREQGATGLMDGVRQRMADCEDDDLGAEVEQLVDETTDDGAIVVWRVVTELSEDRTVEYLMGVVRHGRAVGQVGFVPAPQATIGPDAFVELARRAQMRLGSSPGL